MLRVSARRSLAAAAALFALQLPAAAELWFAAEPAAQKTPASPPARTPRPDTLAEATKPEAPPIKPADGQPREKIEADISTHEIDVTAGFSGTEIVVFGTVDYSRQPSAEAGYYDVAVVIQGPPLTVVARSKSNVAGLWINTGSMLFDAVPSFYAVSTTRPLEEIAEADVLKTNHLGFDYVRMRPRQGRVPNYSPEDLAAYKDAIVRIKQRDHLYPRQDFGVAFIGRSLFRTSIRLPANIPVGALEAHVFLFRDGKVLSTFSAPVKLARSGIEAYIYDFAQRHGALYGIVTVLLAALAGLTAATVFRRM